MKYILLFIDSNMDWNYRATDFVSGFLQVNDLAFTLEISFNQWETRILNILA